VACTTGGPASASWPKPETRALSSTPITSATVSGDTLILNFDQGTPLFEVAPQSSAHFTEMNGRGGPVDLAGSAGIVIVLRGFRGDMKNYTGALDLTPNGPMVLEVREIGDYEGVVGWAVGLSKPACAGVTADGSALTFHFAASA
jgi:hypothetical protein